MARFMRELYVGSQVVHALTALEFLITASD